MAMFCNPDVLYRTSLAKYAAAFFNISLSRVTFESSFFKRLISSDAGSFEVRILPLSPDEPPWDCRRLPIQSIRSHYEQKNEQIFP